jgi:lipoate-protein ligase A
VNAAPDRPRFSYDDDLIDAARADGRTRIRVYRLQKTVVVLGSGSRPEVEVHEDVCRADGVPLLQRRGGGCAVVIDPGNVIVSVVATGLPFGRHRSQFDRLSAWLIEGLAQAGVENVRQAGISDLVLGDRKIAGSAIYRSKDLLYYSASLLVTADLERIARYLRHPPREPEYRAGRDHLAFLTTLAAAMPGLTGESDPESFAQALRDHLCPPGF